MPSFSAVCGSVLHEVRHVGVGSRDTEPLLIAQPHHGWFTAEPDLSVVVPSFSEVRAPHQMRSSFRESSPVWERHAVEASPRDGRDFSIGLLPDVALEN
jgi:hypothetical protein